MTSAARLSRFSARIPSDEKDRLERAAELSGRSLTDFVMGSAHEAARSTIERYEGMALVHPQDREAFVNAMLAPRVPSRRLQEAAARYKAKVEEAV
jgi:uncharacterized protein (DUF1778 family)